MTVVSDSSPLHYLILIEAHSVRPLLFGEVRIPEAVACELRHPSAPSPVRSLLTDPPDWLVVESVTAVQDFEGLAALGAGEREAVALAAAYGAGALLLIDAMGPRSSGRGMGGRSYVALEVRHRLWWPSIRDEYLAHGVVGELGRSEKA